MLVAVGDHLLECDTLFRVLTGRHSTVNINGYNAISTSSTFRPPTNEVGVKSYYCIVTNSLNGYTASEVSDMVTITVEEEGVVEQKGFCQTSFSIGVATGVRLEGKPYGGVKT